MENAIHFGLSLNLSAGIGRGGGGEEHIGHPPNVHQCPILCAGEGGTTRLIKSIFRFLSHLTEVAKARGKVVELISFLKIVLICSNGISKAFLFCFVLFCF